jgi:hypothetical protein
MEMTYGVKKKYWVVIKYPGMKGTHKVSSKPWSTLKEAEDEMAFRKILDKANKVKDNRKYSIEMEY